MLKPAGDMQRAPAKFENTAFIPHNNVLHSPISSSSWPCRHARTLLVADVVGVGGTGKLRFILQRLPV